MSNSIKSSPLVNSNWILEVVRCHGEEGTSFSDLRLWFGDRIQDQEFDGLISKLNQTGEIYFVFQSDHNGTILTKTARVFAHFVN